MWSERILSSKRSASETNPWTSSMHTFKLFWEYAVAYCTLRSLGVFLWEHHPQPCHYWPRTTFQCFIILIGRWASSVLWISFDGEGSFWRTPRWCQSDQSLLGLLLMTICCFASGNTSYCLSRQTLSISIKRTIEMIFLTQLLLEYCWLSSSEGIYLYFKWLHIEDDIMSVYSVKFVGILMNNSRWICL